VCVCVVPSLGSFIIFIKAASTSKSFIIFIKAASTSKTSQLSVSWKNTLFQFLLSWPAVMGGSAVFSTSTAAEISSSYAELTAVATGDASSDVMPSQVFYFSVSPDCFKRNPEPSWSLSCADGLFPSYVVLSAPPGSCWCEHVCLFLLSVAWEHDDSLWSTCWASRWLAVIF